MRDRHRRRRPISLPGLPACLAVLLGAAFAAQWWLTSTATYSLPAFLCLWSAGLAAGAQLARRSPAPCAPPRGYPTAAAARTQPHRRARALAAVALLCAAGATVLVRRGGAPGPAAGAWVAGMGAILLAAWRPRRPRVSRPGLDALPLAAILVVAAALRLPALDSAPYYINYAEAGSHLSAAAIASGRIVDLFSYGWTDLPALGYLWEAGFLRVLGDSLFAMRAGAAVLGVGSIWLLAALGTALYSRRTGLLAAALLAVYHVHLFYSRNGVQQTLAICIVLLALLLLVRALRDGSRPAAVAFALTLAPAAMVYHAARIMLPLAPLLLGTLLATMGRDRRRARLPLLRWMLLGTVVGLGPPAAFILGTWDRYAHRLRQVFIYTAPSDNSGHGGAGAHSAGPLAAAALQLWHAVQTLNVAGDASVLYPTRYPLLDTMSGVLIAAALAYAACSLPRPGPLICLLMVAAVFVFGGAFTTPQPDWDRLVLAAPFLALLIADFLDGLWRLLDQGRSLAAHRAPGSGHPLGGAGAGAVMAFLVAVIAYGNLHWFFQEFIPQSRQDVALSAATDVGRYLGSLPGLPQVIILDSDRVPLDTGVLQLLAPRAQLCFAPDLLVCRPALANATVVVFTPGAGRWLAPVRAARPGGVATVLHRYAGGQQLLLYLLPGV